MGRFNFTGDLDHARERQLDFISAVLEKKGFKGPDARIENVGAAGDNYMAVVKRIIVTENGETFKMIAKLAPDNELMRVMAQMAMVFRNEHTAYTELLPKFVQIQKSAGVEELFRFAECYGSSDEVPNEVILLEDLKESQYEILDRFKPLSDDSVRIVLKNLAIYHSLSYVLKHQEPGLFDEIKSKLGDMYSGPMGESDGLKYFQQLENSSLLMMTDEYKKYIKGSLSEFFNVYKKTIRGDTGSRYSVIQQGDGWINNIMFKSKDGVPAECILIDYQMVRESSPAYDILYMIFNSTSHAQRQKHYYEFLDYYHKELDDSLHNYGLKASMVYPRDQMDCDIKRFGKLMFATSILVSTAITKTSEEAVKMKEAMRATEASDEVMANMFDIHPKTQELFRTRVEGLVDSFLEFGLL